jgi:hypothetical protein
VLSTGLLLQLQHTPQLALVRAILCARNHHTQFRVDLKFSQVPLTTLSTDSYIQFSASKTTATAVAHKNEAPAAPAASTEDDGEQQGQKQTDQTAERV